MKKEFMFMIRNSGDAKKALTPDEFTAFITACEVYIGQLKQDGNLIAAQPLVREGAIIAKQGDDWNIEALDASGQVQVGYYHIRANNLEHAVEIAKSNPEFSYVPSASITVQPVKMKEEQTGFVYPAEGK
jgi:hypothetical protein